MCVCCLTSSSSDGGCANNDEDIVLYYCVVVYNDYETAIICTALVAGIMANIANIIICVLSQSTNQNYTYLSDVHTYYILFFIRPRRLYNKICIIRNI